MTALAASITLAATASCSVAGDGEHAGRPLVDPVTAPDRSATDEPTGSSATARPPTTSRAGDGRSDEQQLSDGTAPSTTDVAASAASAASSDVASLRRLVDEALLRYDRALTDVAVDPLRRGAPGTPQRAAWDAAVLPGSYLSVDMLGSLVRRQQEERMIVVPPDGGMSYVHRALLAEPTEPGVVSFTWCGWSPGTGIDVDSRAAVDVEVAHAHGTGQVRQVEGRWVLDALDQFDLVVLPEGSPDPCPAEAQELGT